MTRRKGGCSRPARAAASTRNRVLAGLAATALQLTVGELVATILPAARSPISGVGRAMIDLIPGPLVDVTVALVEEKDKPLLRGSLIGTALGLSALAGSLRHHEAVGSGLLVGKGVLAALAGATRPDAASLPSVIASTLGTAAGTAALRLLSRRPHPGLLATIVLSATGIGLWAHQRAHVHEAAWRDSQQAVRLPAALHPLAPPSASAGFDLAGVSPLFTPTADFYITDVTFPAPLVGLNAWRLRVCGAVERALALTFDDLLALPLMEVDATLVCVHNPVGGHRLGTARWLGVPVAAVLERAGISPHATHLLARSLDGFSASIPLALLGDERPALVAVGMNGAPLSAGHGFPARLLIPGLYGYAANTKWLSALEVETDDVVPAYWTRRGWPSAPAPIQTHSRIDVPHHRATLLAGAVTIAGVAWSPPYGVQHVEVAIDDGPWKGADLAAQLAPTAWRQWRSDWQATPGEHTIRVRAAGREGFQPEEAAPPYPAGASGYHTISVDVLPPASQIPADGWQWRLSTAYAELQRRLDLALMGLQAWLHHGYLKSRGRVRPE
jgi:DMSO/TMAO reductase YedYZ molybdopterin-dependent catalytic subunit